MLFVGGRPPGPTMGGREGIPIVTEKESSAVGVSTTIVPWVSPGAGSRVKVAMIEPS